MIDERILKNEERAIFALRSIYRKYGYLPYKMSKFEEYDFYAQNKDFLVSDSIITFNDTDGFTQKYLTPTSSFSNISFLEGSSIEGHSYPAARNIP